MTLYLTLNDIELTPISLPSLDSEEGYHEVVNYILSLVDDKDNCGDLVSDFGGSFYNGMQINFRFCECVTVAQAIENDHRYCFRRRYVIDNQNKAFELAENLVRNRKNNCAKALFKIFSNIWTGRIRAHNYQKIIQAGLDSGNFEVFELFEYIPQNLVWGVMFRVGVANDQRYWVSLALDHYKPNLLDIVNLVERDKRELFNLVMSKTPNIKLEPYLTYLKNEKPNVVTALTDYGFPGL